MSSIFTIVGANAALSRFDVAGNQTNLFGLGNVFVVSGSSANDGPYVVASSVYNNLGDITEITVSQPVASSVVGGIITVNTLTFLYVVNQVVFYVSGILNTPNGPNNTCGVQEAVVRSIQMTVDNTGTTIQYTLVFTQQPSNTITTNQANVYPDINSALNAYKTIVLGP